MGFERSGHGLRVTGHQFPVSSSELRVRLADNWEPEASAASVLATGNLERFAGWSSTLFEVAVKLFEGSDVYSTPATQVRSCDDSRRANEP